jgi:hypothetical protein
VIECVCVIERVCVIESVCEREEMEWFCSDKKTLKTL